MSTDVAALITKLKALEGKFPAKVPADVKKDTDAFEKKAEFYLVVLKRFAEDGPSPKALADYSAQKQQLAKLTQDLAKLKDSINGSIKEQKGDQDAVNTVLHDLMTMHQQLQKKLDGNKGAADAAKALGAFAAAAAQAGVPESTPPVD